MSTETAAMTADGHPGNGDAAVAHSSETSTVEKDRRAAHRSDSSAHTGFPGRWRGVWLQFDGETGVLLDRSQTDLWVGQKGRQFSRLCVRKHQSGQSERTFVHGQVTQYDRETGAFTAVAEDRNFIFTTQFQTDRLSMIRLVHKDPSKAKDVRVHGIVSFPQTNRKSVVRQIFLGSKLTIENGMEMRLGDCEFMQCDPDARYCTDPDHSKNYPDEFVYD